MRWRLPLRFTDEELQTDLDMKSGITRQEVQSLQPACFNPFALPRPHLQHPLLGRSRPQHPLLPGCRNPAELTGVKTFANYATCDRSNLADWLGSLDPRPPIHLRPGQLRPGPPPRHRVSEQQLLEDCGIGLGVHRARILTAARGEPAHLPLAPLPQPSPSASPPEWMRRRPRDSGPHSRTDGLID